MHFLVRGFQGQPVTMFNSNYSRGGKAAAQRLGASSPPSRWTPQGHPHKVMCFLQARMSQVFKFSFFFFFFTFWLHHSAHRIPVPGSGMESSAAAVGAQRPNHLAVREVPGSLNHIRLQAHITRSSDLLTPELSWSRSNTQGSDMMSRCCGGPARLRLLRSMGS